MNPRLIAITGSIKGTIFALTDEEVTVGREAGNGLRLVDPSVSRRHCVIKVEGESVRVVDLDSFNGTFVNGVPVKEHIVEHGDQVAIGDLLFIFLLHESEMDDVQHTVLLEEKDLVTRSTVRLQREDALYLQPDKLLAALPQTARVARDLNTLLKISTTINSISNLEALERRLLELIFEIVPAERGAILIADERSDDFISVCGLSREVPEKPVRVSRTITRTVMKEGAAILCNDVLESEAFGEADSLVASRIRSLICVPLMLFEKALGVVYFDASSAGVKFDEEHLQLLTGIAAIASVALEKALHIEWLEDENRRLNQEIGIKHRMIGESPQMREVYQFIAKVAPSDSTVLIRGESGTGKELAAQAIHLNSRRASRAFMAINCATLTETLLESELFGHERGAFTGAIAQKRGKLEVADGGTMFLDEVGELATAIQAKLLRVLQEREFERVGGTRQIKVDVRLIAATNKDLEEAVRSGSFRQDLYYRLNVVSFIMPPLRERQGDIPLLAGYFAAEYSKKSKRRTVRVSAEARACLLGYNWPGNVRELENAIERATVLGTTDLILPEDLPEAVVETASSRNVPVTRYYEALKELKKQLILNAIQQASGNYTEAAKLLGVHPNNLHRLIRNLNLKDALSK